MPRCPPWGSRREAIAETKAAPKASTGASCSDSDSEAIQKRFDRKIRKRIGRIGRLRRKAILSCRRVTKVLRDLSKSKGTSKKIRMKLLTKITCSSMFQPSAPGVFGSFTQRWKGSVWLSTLSRSTIEGRWCIYCYIKCLFPPTRHTPTYSNILQHTPTISNPPNRFLSVFAVFLSKIWCILTSEGSTGSMELVQRRNAFPVFSAQPYLDCLQLMTNHCSTHFGSVLITFNWL